jgi:hypothetical protein
MLKLQLEKKSTQVHQKEQIMIKFVIKNFTFKFY